MLKVKMTAIGNSLGIVLPKEALAEWLRKRAVSNS